jgi:hypothetical protein
MENFLLVIGLVALFLLAALLWKRFIAPRPEIVRLIDAFDDAILDAVIFVSAGYVDLAPYEAKAEERKAKGEMFIDPRMLFVLDKLELYASKYGLVFEFDEVLPRAERIYRELKADGFFG